MGRKKKVALVENLSEAKSCLAQLTQLERMDTSDAPAYLKLWKDDPIASKTRIKESLKFVAAHLGDIRKGSGKIEDPIVQQGITSLQKLIKEGFFKVDEYLKLYHDEPLGTSIEDTKEAKKVQSELKKCMKHIKVKDDDEPSSSLDDLILEDESDEYIMSKIEQVMSDEAYDLLFMRTPEGHAYFGSHLLTHLRKMGDVEAMDLLLGDEDPILKIPALQNHSLQEMSRRMLAEIAPYVDRLDEDVGKDQTIQKHPFVYLTYKMLFSLMMASSDLNLMEKTTTKPCKLYFEDFQLFLRQCFDTEEYKRAMREGLDSEKEWVISVVHLLQILVYSFFARREKSTEISQLIDSLVKSGKVPEGTKKKTLKEQTVWGNLEEQDLKIRDSLSRHPSGHIWTSMDLIREGTAHLKGFDPIGSGNYPHILYALQQKKQSTTILRLPSPTRQSTVEEVEVDPEFRGLIDFFTTQLENQTILIFNLQNRTSWQEHGRASVLEALQTRISYRKNLTVITLPKYGEFYHQTEFYAEIAERSRFKEVLLEQVKSAPNCGFHFPEKINLDDLIKFSDRTIDLISETLFFDKDRYCLQERLDFIEIFYLFLTMKLIAILQPDALSFTCKDGVDLGIAASASLYGFVKEVSGHTHWSDEERKWLTWLLYAPALQIRERAIQKPVFDRMLSAMDRIHDALSRDRITFDKLCKALFEGHNLSQMQLEAS